MQYVFFRRKKIRSNKIDFLSLINKLSDCDLELYSRTSRAKQGRPMSGATLYNKILDMRIDAITTELFDELIKMIAKTPHPAINFSLRWDIDLGYVIKEDNAINFIFKVLNNLEPIYNFIL